jgi:hypothetical protein
MKTLAVGFLAVVTVALIAFMTVVLVNGGGGPPT